MLSGNKDIEKGCSQRKGKGGIRKGKRKKVRKKKVNIARRYAPGGKLGARKQTDLGADSYLPFRKRQCKFKT